MVVNSGPPSDVATPSTQNVANHPDPGAAVVVGATVVVVVVGAAVVVVVALVQFVGNAGIETVEQEKLVPPPFGNPATIFPYIVQALLRSVAPLILFSSTTNVSEVGTP